MPVASIDTNSLVFMTTPLRRNDNEATTLPAVKQRHALAHDFYSFRGVAGLRPRDIFYPQPCFNLTYQRKKRGPSIAPINVASVMPSRYQTAQNATLISGQWKQ